MADLSPAFPFVTVKVDTSGMQPIAQRSPGVVAIVGVGDASIATTTANSVFEVATAKEAKRLFGETSELSRSLQAALLQDPRASTVYGVRVATNDENGYKAALGALDAADDVTLVSLANVKDLKLLGLLKTHVQDNSKNGQPRIGVAMIDNAKVKTDTYTTDIVQDVEALRSDANRMVMIAARGIVSDPDKGLYGDVASAACGAIAGLSPATSLVLKRVRGVSIPTESQYSPTEIQNLSKKGVIPIIQPSLIVGKSFHFAEGRTFATEASYVDIVRVLDDIEFRLKAGLIGMVGDARITRAGLVSVKTRMEGILGPLKRANVLDDFSIVMELLDVLSRPESTWAAADRTLVFESRSQRAVEIAVTVVYGPAVHRLNIKLVATF